MRCRMFLSEHELQLGSEDHLITAAGRLRAEIRARDARPIDAVREPQGIAAPTHVGGQLHELSTQEPVEAQGVDVR
ncbi:MAG: hypothetical protein ACK56F_05020, partial [bacterium]